MIVRFWSVLCLGVLVASAHKAEGNNDNEDDFSDSRLWSCIRRAHTCSGDVGVG
ncbi:hypothetical protein MSG28_011349 [Choristoneura fumiferana]|uniref:Uncharacterized protein n=1 Tax=Choristoneura fumiferana TaxID=7141 RepID=A0ACC0JN20_CHOFU|nr:hypothetical protein MSG28_011349 [Choristoneura fumiferana]